MAYTILNPDGSTLLLLADNQIDVTSTSLTLIGRNYDSYGQDLNNNFVKLLANFASSAGRPPRSPLKGQLWYDSTNRRLKVYDNGFKTVGSVIIADSQPTTLQTGDLWFDSSANQLKVYSSGVVYNVGPAFPSNTGENGWVLPSGSVRDQDSISKPVILLKSYGNTIGLSYYTATNVSFEMDLDDLTTYAPTASTSTVISGITLYENLSVYGQITNNYLSAHVDLTVISPGNDDALAFGGTNGTAAVSLQNPAIAEILTKMFPPNATTATSSSTVLAGIPVGSQSRVLCKYDTAGGLGPAGYQVRVFRTVGVTNSSTWQPFYYTTATVGGADVSINYIP